MYEPPPDPRLHAGETLEVQQTRFYGPISFNTRGYGATAAYGPTLYVKRGIYFAPPTTNSKRVRVVMVKTWDINRIELYGLNQPEKLPMWYYKGRW